MTAPIGVYIHVPFCIRKCPYCDFYSISNTAEAADTYTEALLRAIRAQPHGPLTADTLYFGGGTPILLGAKRLGRILAACGEAFRINPATAEITLEANPAASLRQTLAELRSAGFNRVSFGVQSLDDRELHALGRLHSATQARQAIYDAAEAGFPHISADLMLAVPGQTAETLAASIGGLTALPIDHVSAYLLKIEEQTPFYKNKDALHLPDEDAAAEFYLEAVRRLAAHGFAQYEISNFAKSGAESRHNLKYWRCEPYLGVGPAAHSCLHGKRFHIPRDLPAFLAARSPLTLAVADGESGSLGERVLLGLRLTEGIPINEETRPMLPEARKLAAHGFVRVIGDRIALTPQGFLLSNSVITSLLTAMDL